MNAVLVRLTNLADQSRVVLAAACVIIVAAGVGIAVWQGNRIKSNDEPAYIDLATNLVTHFSYSHTNRPAVEGYNESLPLDSLRPTAFRPPGLPVFIAPFVALGANYSVLRLIHSLLLAATLILLHNLLAVRYSRLAALLGVVMVIGYPALIFLASTLYPQTLAAFLLVASVWFLDRARPDAGYWPYALAGLTFGALMLTVPANLTLAPIILAWMLFIRKASFLRVATTAGMMGLVVGSWTIRNYAVFNEFIPMATYSGYNLFVGNMPGAVIENPPKTPVPKYVGEELDKAKGKGEVEWDRVWSRAAIKFIEEQPAQAALLYVRKFLYWFQFHNELISDEVLAAGSGAGPPLLRDLVMLVTYWPMLLVVIVRLALARRFPLSDLELLLLAIYIGAGLSYAIFFTRIRYRLPYDWLLIAMNAIFIAQWIRVRIEDHARSSAIAGGAEALRSAVRKSGA